MDRFCYAGFPRPLRPRMDVALLLFLVFLNALFAMSETALTASRKARLQVMVEAGDSGAQPCARAARQPDQVALGGADRHHLDRPAQRHRRRGRVLDPARRLAALADRDQRPRRRALALGLVVIMITFISIVFGELVPKRIGLMYPETIARLVARPMEWLSTLTRPFIRCSRGAPTRRCSLHRPEARPRPQRHRGGDRAPAWTKGSTPASSRRRSTRWCATCFASTIARSTR